MNTSDTLGVRPYFKRRSIKRTSHKILSQRIAKEQKYEGMDYDVVDNEVYHREVNPSSRYYATRWLTTILFALLIGVCTGITVFWIIYCEKQILIHKAIMLQKLYTACSDCFWAPFLIYVTLSTFMFTLASFLFMMVQPLAGSCVPEMKGYLNGVKIPGLLTWKSFIAKVIAMIIAGGAGSTGDVFGASLHLGGYWGHFWSSRASFFKADVEKRNFVSAGVSAAWSCAFGSPIGGLLYSIEEGSSFWSGPLSALVFFCSAAALIVFNTFHNGFSSPSLKWGHWARAGIFDFGESSRGAPYLEYPYRLYDFLLYFVLAVLGGLYGGLFNVVNKQLQSFRQKKLARNQFMKFLEVVIIGLVTSVVFFLIPYFWRNCVDITVPEKDLSPFDIEHPNTYCADNQFNPAATIFYQNQSCGFRSVATTQLDWPWAPLLVCALVYSALSCWTFGSALPLGILASTVYQGAMYGKLLGMAFNQILPSSAVVRTSHWAILGAAAFSSSTTRLSISLVCLLMEATSFAYLALPIMFIVVISRWVAGLLSGGLYNNYINSHKIPLLDWFPWFTVLKYRAEQIMSAPPRCFSPTPRVHEVMEELTKRRHNGFPVVDEQGRIIGFILRYQLIILMLRRNFYTKSSTLQVLSTKDFQQFYPDYPRITDVQLGQEEQRKTLNLRPYMDLNPFKVATTTPVSRVFRYFRTLGLRHISVVDASNVVQGIITRKDISKRSAIHLLKLSQSVHRDQKVKSLRAANVDEIVREETSAYAEQDTHVSSSEADHSDDPENRAE